MKGRKLLIFAAAGLVSLALAGYALFLTVGRAHRPPQATATSSAYVDSAVCSGCHPAIGKSYSQTGMARSLYRLQPGNVIENFHTGNSVYNKASDRYYEMRERDGKWYQRRHQIGFDGKQTNVVEKEIDYVIGSGNHVRSYLTRTPEGRLVELPVSWYAEKGGYWAMSPGYDRADQLDFRRTVVTECIGCHDRYLPAGQISTADANVPEFADKISEGIDCQRCHGPGRAHVEAASSGRVSKEAVRRAIVNPVRLPREQQLEVCMQCHLETTSDPLPHAIAKFDRKPFTWRPGEPLSDAFLFFDRADAASRDSFQIAHAAYRLRQSKCFLNSAMTCTTCHNPHSETGGKASDNAAAEHYKAVCASCHATAHQNDRVAAAGSCIDCHMPKRRTDDAVHVVMTDHYIQRRKPAGDLLAERAETPPAALEYHGPVSLYYPKNLPPAPENALYVDVAQVRDGANLKDGIARLSADLQKSAPAGPEFYVELGEAYAKAGNSGQAIQSLDEALRRQPNYRPALVELGNELAATGQLSRAEEILQRAVALPPRDPVVLANLGGVYLREGNAERADQYLQQAIALNPDTPEAHNLRGLLLGQKSDWTGAETELRDAISIQPDLAEAHFNLARLLAATRRLPESGYQFEKAIALRPDYAEAHHNYGLLLAALNHPEKAAAEYRIAIRLQPAQAETHSDLADALALQGKMDQAAEEFRQAIGIDAEFAPAHLGLGLILARQGRAAEARTHLEKAAASPDPDIRESATRALR